MKIRSNKREGNTFILEVEEDYAKFKESVDKLPKITKNEKRVLKLGEISLQDETILQTHKSFSIELARR